MRKMTTPTMMLLMLSIALALVLAAGCASNEPAATVPAARAPAEPEVEETAHTHMWIDADCQNPRTCADCGETEGTPTAHDFAGATCQEPAVCTQCGEADSETAAHEWRDANFQEPQKCTVCGITEGVPLTPGLLSRGYALSELDSVHDFEVPTFQDRSVTTIGQLRVYDLEIIESNETHEAREGFEWRIAHLYLEFSDSNQQRYGHAIFYGTLDYYTPDIDSASGPGNHGSQTVNFYGNDYQSEWKFEVLREGPSGRAYVYEVVFSFLVPVGYDGAAIFIGNAGFINEGSPMPSTIILANEFDDSTMFFGLR